MTLINEKLGQKVFDTYLRFQENKEANTPNLIMEDLGFLHFHYRLKMLGYKLTFTNDVTPIENGNHTHTKTINITKHQNASVRAFKKLKGLISSQGIELDLNSKNLYQKFVEPYLNRQFTPHRTVQYKQNKIIITEILTTDDLKYTFPTCKFDLLNGRK